MKKVRVLSPLMRVIIGLVIWFILDAYYFKFGWYVSLPSPAVIFLEKLERRVYDFWIRVNIPEKSDMISLQQAVSEGGLQVNSTDFVERFDRLSLKAKVSKDIVVVGIDEKTLTELDQWPIKRDLYAKFLHNIFEIGKARGVAFDIMFSERGDSLPIQKLNDLKSQVNPGLQQKIELAINEIDYDSQLRRAFSRFSDKIVAGYTLLQDDEADVKDYSKDFFNTNLAKYTIGGENTPEMRILNSVQYWKGGTYNYQELRDELKFRGYFSIPPDIDGTVRQINLLTSYAVQLKDKKSDYKPNQYRRELLSEFTKNNEEYVTYKSSRELFGSYALETVNMASATAYRAPSEGEYGLLYMPTEACYAFEPELHNKFKGAISQAAEKITTLSLKDGKSVVMSDLQKDLLAKAIDKLDFKWEGSYENIPLMIRFYLNGLFKDFGDESSGFLLNLMGSFQGPHLRPLLVDLPKNIQDEIVVTSVYDFSQEQKNHLKPIHKNIGTYLAKAVAKSIILDLSSEINPLFSFSYQEKQALYKKLISNMQINDEFFKTYMFEPDLDEMAMGKKLKENPKKIKMGPNGQVYVSYKGMPLSYVRYSMVDIIKAKNGDKLAGALYNFKTADITLRDALEDKIVLLGPTALGINDWRVTPVHRQTDGVEIHAHTIDCLRTETQILRPDGINVLESLALILASLFLPFSIRRLNASFGALVTLIILVTHGGICAWSFQHGIYLKFMPFLLLTAFQYIFLNTYEYIQEEKERKKTKGAFSHYVNASVVDAVLNNPDMLKLGGQKIDMTVLFSDVRSFTTISEKLDPQTLVALMNEYLEEMTDLVMHYDGTLDKFIGDAVMAFWGAPVHQDNHAELACITAIEMNKRLDVIREDLYAKYEVDIRVGIGLNTGPMVVGNMGSRTRFNYTIIGDAVNLGARLEGQTKNYGAELIVSQTTYELVKDWAATRFLDLIAVKGKTEPVRIYECIGYEKEMDKKTLQGLKEFEDAIDTYYLGRKFKEGVEAFEKLKKHRGGKDVACDLYISRCKDFMENPPDEAWNGVFVATSK
jgi:class 3 adenylate cyclase